MVHVFDVRDYKNAIDNGGILYIGRDRFDTSRALQFALMKNGRKIMVQVQYTGPLDTETPGMTPGRWEYLTELEFEVVMSMLPQIEFDRVSANWVYVVRDRNGYYLVYRDRKRAEIVTDHWAQLVDEKEIEVHRYFSYDEGEGVWRGQNVRFRYAWCNHHSGVQDLLSEYAAYFMLRNLDLTFKVLALVTIEGRVTGWMWERPHGRTVQYRDRSLVYDAVAKIQRNGLLYYSMRAHNIIITDDGKVRFIYLDYSIAYFEPHELEELERRAEEYHWKALQDIFDQLKDVPEHMEHHLQSISDTHLIFPNARCRPSLASYYEKQLLPWLNYVQILHRAMRKYAAELTIKSRAKKVAKHKQRLLLANTEGDLDASEDRPLIVSRRKPGMLSVGIPDRQTILKSKPIALKPKAKKKLLAPTLEDLVKYAKRMRDTARLHDTEPGRFEEILD